MHTTSHDHTHTGGLALSAIDRMADGMLSVLLEAHPPMDAQAVPFTHLRAVAAGISAAHPTADPEVIGERVAAAWVASYSPAPEAPAERMTPCPDCGRTIGYDGHAYGPCGRVEA